MENNIFSNRDKVLKKSESDFSLSETTKTLSNDFKVLESTCMEMKIKNISLQVREYYFENLYLSMLKNYHSSYEKIGKKLSDDDIFHTATKVEYQMFCSAKTSSDYKSLIIEQVINIEKSINDGKLNDLFSESNVDVLCDFKTNSENAQCDDNESSSKKDISRVIQINSEDENFVTADEASSNQICNADTCESIADLPNSEERQVSEVLEEHPQMTKMDKLIFETITPIVKEYYKTDFIPTAVVFARILQKLHIDIQLEKITGVDEMKKYAIKEIECRRYLYSHCISQ